MIKVSRNAVPVKKIAVKTCRLLELLFRIKYQATVRCEVNFFIPLALLTELSGFIPFLLQLFALHLHHFVQFRVSSVVKLLFFGLVQVCFVCPRFLLPLQDLGQTIKTLLSSLLSTCPYHLSPFGIARPTTASL